MINLSKYFKQDIIDTNQVLKPIIRLVAGGTAYYFALDTEKFIRRWSADISGDEFTAQEDKIPLPCIDKVSNVKVSSDFDSKKLKINRLRVTLSNYYDLNTKLSEYMPTNIINSTLQLFYKSPTTTTLNTHDNTDYDMPLIFEGEISRININDAKIDLTIEDRTQIKIADKNVPYMSIDKLDQNIKDGVLEKYKKDTNTVPMTYGMVDKAPVLPYLEQGSDRMLNILFDVQPTSSSHKTAKIPALLDAMPNNHNNTLYIKSSDDYIIWEHETEGNTLKFHNQFMPKFIVFNSNGSTGNYLLPELQTEVQTNIDFGLWSINGLFQRKVKAAYASDGSILDIADLNTEDITNTEFENVESVHNHGNKDSIWYRSGDTIQSLNDNFDTGLKNYPSDSDYAVGRWIVLKLDEGISNNLLTYRVGGIRVGNTIMLSDYNLYQNEDEEADTPNTTSLPAEAEQTGFFVAPIAEDVWKNLVTPLLGSNLSAQVKYQCILNALLSQTDDHIGDAEKFIDDDEPELIENTLVDNINVYENAPIYLDKNLHTDGSSKFWGSVGSNNGLNNLQQWKGINGLYYGDTGASGNVLSNEANAHGSIAIYEYFPPYWKDVNSYQQGLRMNNIGFLQSVLVEDVQQEEIYASITGRRNQFFTAQMDYSFIPEGGNLEGPEEILYNDIAVGPDGLVPDIEDDQAGGSYNLIGDTIRLVFTYWFKNAHDAWFDDSQLPYDNDHPISMQEPMNTASVEENNEFINNFVNFSNSEFFLEELMSGGYDWTDHATAGPPENMNNRIQNLDDSPFWKSMYFFKNYFARTALVPLKMLQTVNAVQHCHDFFNGYQQPKPLYTHYRALVDMANFLTKKLYAYVFYANQDYAINTSPFRITFYTGYGFWNEQPQLNIYVTSGADGFTTTNYDVNTLEDWLNNLYVHTDKLIRKFCKEMLEEFKEELEDDPNYDVEVSTIDIDEFITYHPFASGLGYLEGSELSLEYLRNNLLFLHGVEEIEEQETLTEGIIQKPSDIVMNILTTEMGYAKYDESQVQGNETITPDYDQYDIDSIEVSRQTHSGYKMGFSIDKKTDGKKLIENILKESKSYPRFSSDGRFGLITIKESYTYDDIDIIIDTKDIMAYKFSQSKREDILTSGKFFYRYDNGQNNYPMYIEKAISDIMPSYTGFDDYNLTSIDTHKEINLRYHVDTGTVENFARYTLLNNCNPHNQIEMTIPLKYMEMSVGTIVHLPLIKKEKIFNIDYSVVDNAAGQPTYPLWIVMETNIGANDFRIKAVQLHYLGTDGNHGFVFPNGEYEVLGNMNEYNTTYPTIKNWNYNRYATQHNGIEIPYFDINGDGVINAVDLVALINMITTNNYSQAELARGNVNGGVVNVVDLVNMVNTIITLGTNNE